MKKILYLLVLVIFLVQLTTSTSFAHILESEGSVGAVLHINPDDDPLANNESIIYLEFKDKNNRFQLQNCDCTVTVLKSGEKIHTQSLTPTNDTENTGTFNYIFPEKNIYKIKVTGKPYQGNSFEDFTFTYDIRVARENSDNLTRDNEKKQYNVPWLYITLTLLVFILSIIVIIKRKQN